MNRKSLLPIALLVLCCSVPDLRAQDTPVLRASLALDQLMTWFQPVLSHWEGVGWWHSGNCLTSLIEYSQRTGNRSFDSLYERAYVTNALFFLEGYDDEGWWGLAWLDAYKLTGDEKYLNLAKLIFDDMTIAWDDTCGGGVWWDRKRTYKNAITNELFLSIAAQLYIFTQDATYLKYAQEEWNWFSTVGLINSQNLINDGLNQCKNNQGSVWTYNQGVVLGGLVSLYNITRNETYLDSAEKIANATLTILVTSNNILQESCEVGGGTCDSDQLQFKGVFMRNLGYLYTATKSQYYADFITNNANSIWTNDRNGTSLGLKWSGPFDSADPARQSSALDALNAVLVL